MNKRNIGLIARDNNKGLGIQTWEFFKHLKPVKTLVIEFNEENKFPERFPGARFTTLPKFQVNTSDIDWLLDGIDVLFSCETFYFFAGYNPNCNLRKRASEMGVKMVLQPNYEWWSDADQLEADLYLPPSLYYFNKFPDPKVYLPFPVNRKLFPFKLRKKAKVFFHSAGSGQGVFDRDGTEIVLQAIPLVKSNVKFIIKSQRKIRYIKDNRIEWRIKDYENYWEGVEGDVDLYPRRYAGQSLQLNEAMSLGMVPIMIDCSPVNKFLPKELLINPTEKKTVHIKQDLIWHSIEPRDLAAKIDELANQDISRFSKLSDHIAQSWSWETLAKRYRELL